jgi:HEAT repeat protein
MNGFIAFGRVAVVIVAMFGVSLSAGCGGGGNRNKPREVRLNRPPKEPPRVPARQNVTLDPALQESARQEIKTASTSSNPLIRAHSIEAMRESMGETASESIIAALVDPEAIVRFAAALASGELRLHQAKDQLLVLSDDVDPSVQVGAKFALHRIGDPRQSHDLEKTSRDPSARTRGDTALVLGLLGEPSAVKILMPMLFDKSPAVRLQAAEALWRLGNQNGMEALVAASISKFPDDQMIALAALAGPRDRRVLGHVEGALVNEDGYEPVSLVAARSAGMLGSEEGYGVAIRGVKSSDPRERMLGALALGAIGRADGQTYLTPLLRDSDQDVRLAAATAILQLK